MIYILLAVSLSAALMVNVTKKIYSGNYQRKLSDGFLFSAFSFIVATIILLIFGVGETSRFTFVMGLLFGAVTTLQSITMILAFKIGPMAYTSVIINFSTLLTALSGVLWFDEKLYAPQMIGIALMLISFICSANGEPGQKKANAKWLSLCIVSFLATGGIGIMQKLHQSSAYKSELNSLLVIAFTSSSVFALALAAIFDRTSKLKGEDTKSVFLEKNKLLKLVIVIVLQGIGVAVNNEINLYLSGVMSSSVFFPTVNGGGLILTTLCSVIIFKERLSLKQWIGIAVGILSVVLVCNPF